MAITGVTIETLWIRTLNTVYILVKISGRKKDFGLPPNTTMAKFYSKKDIPIAEHKQEIRGEFLKGRYAKRSTEIPNRTVNKIPTKNAKPHGIENKAMA